MPIIQSVERALQILNLFNEQTTELKITDISKQMGLSKSTLHSLCSKRYSCMDISIKTLKTVNIGLA